MVRDWSAKSCSHILDGYQRDRNSNHTPKSELPSAANNRGDENSNRTPCQPHVDDKCARPPSPQPCSKLHANNTNTMESTTPPSSIPKHAQPSANSFLHSSGVDQCQPTSLPLATHASPTRTSSVCPYDDTRHSSNELSSSHIYGPPRTKRNSKEKGLVHRNIKSQKLSPYGFSRERGQKIHSQLSNSSEEMIL
uniref:Uncharacterized protein n=1 Tax=Solanum tuberosum TaxID=4113 RepID=M1DNN2_SOLTU